MTTIKNVPAGNLTQDAIESIAESRLYSRFADLEDKLEGVEEVFAARDERKAFPRASEPANAPQ